MASGEDKQLTVREAISLDSVPSFNFPWRVNLQRGSFLILVNQTVRQVNGGGFFLCLCSMVILCFGIAICAATIWSMAYRIPYMKIARNVVSISSNVFGLCAGMISLPCFYLACIVHDNKKNYYIFLPIFMALICIALAFTATSIALGMVDKSHFRFKLDHKPPVLLSTFYGRLLNSTMLESMLKYGEKEDVQKAWNKVQARLKCCGTNNYTDWISIRQDIPLSCCPNLFTCSYDGIYKSGCVDLVAFDFTWDISLVAAVNAMMFINKILALLTAGYIYLKKLKPSEQRQESYFEEN